MVGGIAHELEENARRLESVRGLDHGRTLHVHKIGERGDFCPVIRA